MLEQSLDGMQVRTRGATAHLVLLLCWLGQFGPLLGVLWAMARLGDAPLWAWADALLPVLAVAWALAGGAGLCVLGQRMRHRVLRVDARGWQVAGTQVPAGEVAHVAFLEGRLRVHTHQGRVVRSAPLPRSVHDEVVAMVHAWDARQQRRGDPGAAALPEALKALVGRARQPSSG